MRNTKRPFEKFKGKSSTSRKHKREKNDAKDAWKKSNRCHECWGFVHVESKCPSYKKTPSKALKATLIDDKSSFDNQRRIPILLSGKLYGFHIRG